MLQMKWSWMSTSIQMSLCNPHLPRCNLQDDSQSRSSQPAMKIFFIKWRRHVMTNHLWSYSRSHDNLLGLRCHWEIDGSHRPQLVVCWRQSQAEESHWNCTHKDTLSETAQLTVEDENLKHIIPIHTAAAISNYHDHKGGLMVQSHTLL